MQDTTRQSQNAGLATPPVQNIHSQHHNNHWPSSLAPHAFAEVKYEASIVYSLYYPSVNVDSFW